MIKKSLAVFVFLFFLQATGLGQTRQTKGFIIESNLKGMFAPPLPPPGNIRLKTDNIEYSVGDQLFSGILAESRQENNSTPKPGILYFPGNSETAQETRGNIEALAKAHYVVFAVSMYPKGTTQKTPLTAAQIDERIKESLNILVNQPFTDTKRIAAVGLREGASYALELVRSGLAVTAVGIDPSRISGTTCSAANCKGLIYLIKSETPVGGTENLRTTDPKSKDALRWNIESVGGKAGFSELGNPNLNVEILIKTEKLTKQFLANRFAL